MKRSEQAENAAFLRGRMRPMVASLRRNNGQVAQVREADRNSIAKILIGQRAIDIWLFREKKTGQDDTIQSG